MVRRAGVVGVAVAVVVVMAMRGGWTPFVAPAGATPVRTSQATPDDEVFSFQAVVPPGGVVLLDRPPTGSTFLVTDVLVQNQPVGGDLADLMGPGERSMVTIGSASQRGPSVDARTFTSAFQVRVIGADLQQTHLEFGFIPVVAGRDRGDRLAVFNAARSSATAFVQIYGRVTPL